MVRIVVAVCAELQHFIIAGALPFDTQPSRREPDEGIEPIETAYGLKDNLQESVITPHVRQFVGQHKAAPVRCPRSRGRGKQHHGPEDAPCHWRNRLIGNPECDGPLQIVRRLQIVQNIEPACVLDQSGVSGKLADSQASQQEAQQDDTCTDDPCEKQRFIWRDLQNDRITGPPG